ncbi:MAG TPA: YcnI family protein [Nocardioidaceae bacterium]|nr:YcnI family protein [Nocardioidaceae bacterium]
MVATGAGRARPTMPFMLGVVAAATGVLLLPAVASAHVEVKPASVPGGDFAEVAFSVPNEETDASTVNLVVVLPTDPPLASVETTPLPGWRVTTKQRTLSEPIELEGAQISEVVSQVTWQATGPGIAPGEFQDFPVSLGVLPTSGDLVFKAVQTYSNGDVVTWNESAIGGAEPEHPAPTLELTAPADGGSGDHHADDQAGGQAGNHADEESGDDSGDTLAIALSIAALLVSLGALGIVLKRGRP